MRLYLLIIYIVSSFGIYAQKESVPLDPTLNTPAHNLMYQGSPITSDQAQELLRSGHDLSRLDPEADSMWQNQITQNIDYDNKLTSKPGENVDFKNIVETNDGLMRFDALRSDNSVATYYLDPKMHITLLRKNLLRKLGYKIPAIKRLETLHVFFETPQDKKDFLQEMSYKLDLFEYEKRWVISQTELSLELRDLSQIESGRITYNSAMGVPPGYQSGRTIRSLLFVYALLDLDESVNKVRCDAGKRVGSKLVLPYFFGFADFSSVHIDDLKWIARLVAPLSKADFKQLIDQAHYPSGVSDILAEKLRCRKEHLLSLLKVGYESESEPVNLDKSVAPYLDKGKVIKFDWTEIGYAARFSKVDAPSPFKDFHMLILSMLQSIGIDAMVGKFNKLLQGFDPQKARFKLAKKEFEEGLDHFVKTGEFLQFPVSAWASPVLDGRFILSRDVIIGNYLGTDNLVQLADTFGYSADAGVLVGFENFTDIAGATVKANFTFTKTFTHIKPIQTLKTVFKEPYKNMMVPLLKMDLRRGLKAVSENQKKDETKNDEKLDEILSIINKTLGIGESLLITQRFNKGARGSLSIPRLTSLWGNFLNIRLGFGAGHIGVKRLHILRRNENTLQIFDDRGNGIFTDFSIDLSYLIPIMRYSSRKQKGQYSVQFNSINIDGSATADKDVLKNNLKIFENILKKNDFSIIEKDPEIAKTIGHLDGDYRDHLQQAGALIWRNRRLRTYTQYLFNPIQVDKPGKYVSYRDHTQTGKNWEGFVKDVANFYLRKVTQDVAWANNIWQNPSDTILGASRTFEMDYEAFNNDNKLTRDFISVTERLEGWSKNETRLKDFARELNEKHKLDLFTPEMFEQINRLSLYDIYSKFIIYEEGIRKFKDTGLDELIKYAYFVEKKKGFKCRKPTYRKLSDGTKLPTCHYLGAIITNHKACKKRKNQRRAMRCWTRAVKKMYKKFNALELARFFGRENIYVYAKVNGFRKNSELFYTPEESNGYGEQSLSTPDGIISLLQGKFSIPAGEFEGFWLRSRL